METSDAKKGYCEGDLCPELNKRIHTLIVKTKKYVIFLDDEFFVQWAEFDTNTYAENYNEVMNRVSYLETISTTHFAERSNDAELLEFRRLLGEAVFRVYDGAGDSAVSILGQAEQLLIDRSVQRARQWYLLAASGAAIFPAISLVILWFCRVYVRSLIGTEVFDVLIYACLGGIGALAYTIIGIRKVNLNSSAGSRIHYIEGAAKITVGIIGGALVTLAVKSNIFLGIINSSNNPKAFLAFVALASGASERLVPDLIKQIEIKAASDHEKD